MVKAHKDYTYSGTVIYSADNTPFQAKPKGVKIGGIRNRLGGENAHTETSIKDLAILIQKGFTIQGAQLRSKQNDAEDTDIRFLSQQIFAVDLDNVYKDQKTGQKVKLPDAIESPEQIFEISKGAGLTPCIISESFSSTPELRKYHVLFAVDKPIRELSQAKQIILNLQDVFSVADEACKDPARILFGTSADKDVYVYNAVNTAEALLTAHSANAPTLESVTTSKQEKPVQSNYNSSEADPFHLLQMIDPNSLT